MNTCIFITSSSFNIHNTRQLEFDSDFCTALEVNFYVGVTQKIAIAVIT